VLARVNEEMVTEGLISFDEAYRLGSMDARALRKKTRPEGAKTPGIEPKPIIALADLERAAAGTLVLDKPVEAPVAEAPAAVRLTTIQKIKLIEKTLDEVRPYLKLDGGDCELVDVDGNNVIVKLAGACAGCQQASLTVGGVQEKLIAATGLPLRVIPVK
jgi:NifU-like protein